jgi:hypothetical protein
VVVCSLASGRCSHSFALYYYTASLLCIAPDSTRLTHPCWTNTPPFAYLAVPDGGAGLGHGLRRKDARTISANNQCEQSVRTISANNQCERTREQSVRTISASLEQRRLSESRCWTLAGLSLHWTLLVGPLTLSERANTCSPLPCRKHGWRRDGGVLAVSVRTGQRLVVEG